MPNTRTCTNTSVANQDVPRVTMCDHVCVCTFGRRVRMALCRAADLYTDTCILTSTMCVQSVLDGPQKENRA